MRLFNLNSMQLLKQTCKQTRASCKMTIMWTSKRWLLNELNSFCMGSHRGSALAKQTGRLSAGCRILTCNIQGGGADAGAALDLCACSTGSQEILWSHYQCEKDHKSCVKHFSTLLSLERSKQDMKFVLKKQDLLSLCANM